MENEKVLIERCPVCGGVAHFKCENCGEEWYDRTQSLASSAERFAPQVRELKKQLDEFKTVLKLLHINRKPELNVVWVHGEAIAAKEIERLLREYP